MPTKFLTIVSIVGLAALCVAQAQSPTPAESPSPAKKHRVSKKAASTASPTVSPSPLPAKKTLADLFKPKASPSPAAPGPAPAKGARAEAATKATPAPGGGHGLVWVNTETHVYHKEGSRFYGKTKKGKFVSEADAIKEGDKAAKRE
jgi:hypothetical protein